MLGAIAGDIIGSIYEKNPIKTKEFELFKPECRYTDDTVMSIAIAKSIIEGSSYLDNIVDLGLRYFNVGYGSSFKKWLKSEKHEPYNSWGNGSAMRVSPISFFYNNEKVVLEEAEKSAIITHNHNEGIKGAKAVALATYLAKIGTSKQEIKKIIESKFDYNLSYKVDDIRPNYSFYVSCQKSVPESIICFLDSVSYEDCIRNAISLGGDADTMATISGGIAEAYYGVIPKKILENVFSRLPKEFIDVIKLFYTSIPNTNTSKKIKESVLSFI